MNNYTLNIGHEINGLMRKARGDKRKDSPLSSKEKHIQKLIKYSLMGNGVFR